jgi:hypothetical protein
VDLGGSYVGCRGGDSSPPTPRVWSRVDLSCPEGSCRVRRPVLLLFPSLHGVIFVVDLFGGNREQRASPRKKTGGKMISVGISIGISQRISKLQLVEV